MKIVKRVIIVSIFLVLILSFQSVDAQQNIAQQAYAIFENSCNGCHGEGGSYTEQLRIQYPNIIDDGSVIPGDPVNSEFYKRLIETDPLTVSYTHLTLPTKRIV